MRVCRRELASLEAVMATITTAPTTTLSNAEAWAAAFAPDGDREPIKFPTRVDAATPIPKGRVFKTIKPCQFIAIAGG
jgi:hypothetical protein